MRTWWRDPLGVAIKRYKAIKNYIIDINPDIICTQELVPPFNWCIPRGYKKASIGLFEHPVYIKQNLKVLWKKNFTYRGVAVCVTDGYETYVIINVHSHWDMVKHVEDMHYVQRCINTYKKVIATGDFNVEPKDSVMKEYITDGGYTFVNKQGYKATLDYAVTEMNVKVYVGEIGDSDHAPIVIYS